MARWITLYLINIDKTSFTIRKEYSMKEFWNLKKFYSFMAEGAFLYLINIDKTSFAIRKEFGMKNYVIEKEFIRNWVF